MAISFSCSCGRKINAKDEHAGKRVKCPGCQQPVTVPAAGAAAASAAAARPAAAMASAGAKTTAGAAAPRKPAAAAKPKPAPVDDDMYDIKEDAPPAKPGRAAAVAPASPWGDDDPGLDAPIAAPRPYVPSAGSPAAAPGRAAAAGAAPAAGAAGGLGTYAALGSKRGSAAPVKGGKVASGLHLGGFAKFMIGAAILIPTTFFIIRQGPVKAVAEWEKAEVLGEDSTRSVLSRVIHDMDVATMPPPDPDRDNKDGIPYHPQVNHFYFLDAPMIMWRMADKVEFRGNTTFGPYEGWYYTRENRVECTMEWKGDEKLTIVGQCKPDSSVETVTVDGISSNDVMAISKKFDGYHAWQAELAQEKAKLKGAGGGATAAPGAGKK